MDNFFWVLGLGGGEGVVCCGGVGGRNGGRREGCFNVEGFSPFFISSSFYSCGCGVSCGTFGLDGVEQRREEEVGEKRFDVRIDT